MADNKKQTSLSILGIDTASPDHEVKDGKCSELHNLRYAAGAWRNVHPFVKRHNLPQDGKYQIIYHHPADADNRYIATSRDEWTETYYAWRTGTGVTLYTLVEPSKIKVGDALYDRPDMEFAPEYFEQIGTVAGVNVDGSITYRKETYSHEYFYGWASEAGAEYYTRSATPQVEDEVFALVENTYLNSVAYNLGRVGI